MPDEFVKGAPPKNVTAVEDEFVQGPPQPTQEQPSKPLWKQLLNTPLGRFIPGAPASAGGPNLASIAQGAANVPAALMQVHSRILAPRTNVPAGFGTGVGSVGGMVNPYAGYDPVTKTWADQKPLQKEEATRGIDQVIKEENEWYDKNFDRSVVGEMAGAILFPLPGGPSLSAVKTLSKAAKAGEPLAIRALKGLVEAGKVALKAAPRAGLEAALTSPVVNAEGMSDQDYYKEKLKQFGVGAAIGGGLGGGIRLATNAVTPAKRALEALLEKAHSIRETTGATVPLGDASTSPLLQSFERAIEWTPLSGMTGVRKKGAQAFADKMEGIRAAAEAKTTPGAQGVDYFGSAARAAAERDRRLGEPFEQIQTIVDSFPGATKVDDALAKTRATIENIETPNLSAGTIAELNRVVKDLERMQERGVTYRKVKKLKKTMGKKASDAFANNNTEEGHALMDVYDALAGEQENATRALDPSGDLHKMQLDANEAWKAEKIPYDLSQKSGPTSNKKFAELMVAPKGQEESKLDMIMAMRNKDLPKYINEGIDQAGRDALKSKVLDIITGKATEGKTPISPAKLRTAINNREAWITALFPAKEAEQLRGIAKASEHMERFGQYMERLGTGLEVEKMGTLKEILKGIGVAGGAKMVGGLNPAVAAALMGGARGYTMLTATKAGQDFLRKAAMSTPGSRHMRYLIENELPVALAAAQQQEAKP